VGQLAGCEDRPEESLSHIGWKDVKNKTEHWCISLLSTPTPDVVPRNIYVFENVTPLFLYFHDDDDGVIETF
jgi:hypothetical protein